MAQKLLHSTINDYVKFQQKYSIQWHGRQMLQILIVRYSTAMVSVLKTKKIELYFFIRDAIIDKNRLGDVLCKTN